MVSRTEAAIMAGFLRMLRWQRSGAGGGSARRAAGRRGVAAVAALAVVAGCAGTGADGRGSVARPAACPAGPVRVVRSGGGETAYRGTVAGRPELCRMVRPDGAGVFVFGVWRSDWPGAGEALPALRAVIGG
ncbi:MAG: hypothetical protein ACRYG6_05755, partial [Janthinobacterium lividum]